MQKRGKALREAQEGASAGSGSSGNSPASDGSLIPSFAPVPRRYRHDGWTPERQKGFIEALADCGCVTRAAAMVNMAQTNCYTLRRSAGAEGFRRAWDAALDFGQKRLKDIAFERVIEGYLVPVFVGGKLMGFRRKHNDALLMFCIRHYGQDEGGRRTTINYFSSRATAGAVGGVLRDGASPLRQGSGQAGSAAPQDERVGSGAQAEASTTTVRTVVTGRGGSGEGSAERLDEAAEVLNGFEGVALDDEAMAAIGAALEACAERARAAQAAYEKGGEAAADAEEADPATSFIRVGERANPYRGELIPSAGVEEFVPFAPGEPHWQLAGAEKPEALVRFEEGLARGERAAAT